MKPLGVWFSLTLSVCWFIALLAVLLILTGYQKIRYLSIQEEIFLIVGIFTSYFDFLTYPVVTLGVPLCVWLICESADQTEPGEKGLARMGGYIGMWAMKWVLSELLYRTGTLRNAVWSVIYRTTPLDGYHSSISGIPRTWRAILDQYDSPVYSIVFWIIAAAAILSVILCIAAARNAKWAMTVIFLGATALFPFGWFVLTQNHTAIHCTYTFRIMGVSIMALCGITVVSVKNFAGSMKEKPERDTTV